MKIVGFNLSKTLIERKDGNLEKPKITQNIDILEVSKEKNPVTSSEILKVKFSFSINYSENFAKLEFQGTVVLMPSENELKEFLKSWKDKQIPETSRIPLFNFIMNKCNIKALSLEDEFGLPFHVPLPRLSPNDNKK